MNDNTKLISYWGCGVVSNLNSDAIDTRWFYSGELSVPTAHEKGMERKLAGNRQETNTEHHLQY